MNAFIISASVFSVVFVLIIFLRIVKISFLILRLIFVIIHRLIQFLKKIKYMFQIHWLSRDLSSYKYMSPTEIGKRGEEDLCKKLKHIDKDGKILRNLYIPLSDGTTAEIDAVMLTQYGIFVFEYKNYHCNMFIPENLDNNWMRCGYDNFNVYDIYSPVRQNRNHVTALKQLLEGISGMKGIERCLKSYVILGDGCKIRTEHSSLKSKRVMNLSDLRFLDKDSDYFISPYVLLIVETFLVKYQDVAESVRKQHINTVKNLSQLQFI